jgi:hypothetical protein
VLLEGFIVRRILASLIVISALIATGVFATGAYFQTSQAGPGWVSTTGAAHLKITQESPSNFPTPPFMVGPGFDRYTCIGIENDGNYTLDVTLSLAFPAGNAALEQAMYASLHPTDSSCTGYGTDYTLDQYIGNPQTLATGLAPLAKAYVVMRLHWNETGTDQSALQNSSLTVLGTITGQTPH